MYQTKVLVKELLKVDVYLTIRVVLCPKEVEKMVARSNLDALTSGMLAKLDPLSRIAREQRAARWISITRNGSAALPKYSLRPGRRPAGHVTELQFPAVKK